MIEVKVQFNAARINKVLQGIPREMAATAYGKGLPAAAKIAVAAAKQRAPRGEETGTTARQGPKSKSLWGSQSLADLIASKIVRPKGWLSYALIGARRPVGNKINFVSPNITETRKVMLWGNEPVNAMPQRRRHNRFLEQAMDETRSQQQRAFIQAMIRHARKAIAKSGRLFY